MLESRFRIVEIWNSLPSAVVLVIMSKRLTEYDFNRFLHYTQSFNSIYAKSSHFK